MGMCRRTPYMGLDRILNVETGKTAPPVISTLVRALTMGLKPGLSAAGVFEATTYTILVLGNMSAAECVIFPGKGGEVGVETLSTSHRGIVNGPGAAV